MLFPALRVGYMVVPPDLVDGFVSARTTIDLHPPTLGRIVLTDFLEEGHLRVFQSYSAYAGFVC